MKTSSKSEPEPVPAYLEPPIWGELWVSPALHTAAELAPQPATPAKSETRTASAA